MVLEPALVKDSALHVHRKKQMLPASVYMRMKPDTTRSVVAFVLEISVWQPLSPCSLRTSCLSEGGGG